MYGNIYNMKKVYNNFEIIKFIFHVKYSVEYHGGNVYIDI